MIQLSHIRISGADVLPIVEGGKGINATNGFSAGAFAAAGCIGTFSGVFAKLLDDNGDIIPLIYKGKTRRERHEELIEHSIKSGIQHANIAKNVSKGKGRIHINVLWEMGGCQRILHGILSKTKGIIDGVTCGAGMPYKLHEITKQYDMYYLPIVSSMRAFRALWKRSYHKCKELLSAVVYEDPWKAGGHNGLSNSEDPNVFESPMSRLIEIRAYMNECNLHDVPIIMAGGVWNLNEWSDYIDNPEVDKIAFQFGTRPIVTIENPVPDEWKKRLFTLKDGDVCLNKFSPTGFYSSAVNNNFIAELRERSERQFSFSNDKNKEFSIEIPFGKRGRFVYIKPKDKSLVDKCIANGFANMMKTPDDTIVLSHPEHGANIHQDQTDCMGCLSHCRFSNWKDSGDYNTGKRADPRSYCIQKTLQDIGGGGGDIENNLMFSGHNAYRFSSDLFYQGGKFIPTTQQLVDRIMTGE